MRELEEAESWLEAAKFTLENTARGSERFTTAVAQAIHALIRANDALTVRFLRKRSSRHEDAAALFGDLVRQNKIPAPFASQRKLLVRASAEKSKYDYKGVAVGKDEAARWIRDTAEFIVGVKQILGI